MMCNLFIVLLNERVCVRVCLCEAAPNMKDICTVAGCRIIEMGLR